MHYRIRSDLKWTFSEAAILFLRDSSKGKSYVEKLAKRVGKGKALSILAHKIGRATYFIMKRNDAFGENYFFSSC